MGEFLLYLDAGIEIVRSVEPLWDCCSKNRGVLLFHSGGRSGAWTKRDTFVLSGCDHEHARRARIAAGGMLVFQKTEFSVSFLREWLEICCDHRALGDGPNLCGQPNYPEFRAHRHDQSVLSLLAYKHSIELYRSPCQYGDYLKAESIRQEHDWLGEVGGPRPYVNEGDSFQNSPYPTLFHIHRQRNSTSIWRRPGLMLWMLLRALRAGGHIPR